MVTQSKRNMAFMLFSIAALIITVFAFALVSLVFTTNGNQADLATVKNDIVVANNTLAVETNNNLILKANLKSYSLFYNATKSDFENLLAKNNISDVGTLGITNQLSAVQSLNADLKRQLLSLEAQLK